MQREEGRERERERERERRIYKFWGFKCQKIGVHFYITYIWMLRQSRRSIDRGIQISWYAQWHSRASLTAFICGRIGLVERESERRDEKVASLYLSHEMSDAVILRIEQFWIADASRISPSTLEPCDRFEINQRFRTVDLPPTFSPLPHLSLSLSLSLSPLSLPPSLLLSLSSPFSLLFERSVASSHEIGASSHI